MSLKQAGYRSMFHLIRRKVFFKTLLLYLIFSTVLVTIALIENMSLIYAGVILFFFAVFHLVLDLSIQRPLALIQRALTTDDASIVETLALSKDKFGQIASHLIQSSEQRKELVTEIDERKRIEGILRESEERYRNVVETSPDIILVMDLTANILIGNLRAASLFDITESVLVENLQSFFHLSEQENFKKVIDNVIRKGRVYNVDCIMLKKDGKSFNAEASLSLLKNDKGEPKNILAIIKDVTELKCAELERAKFEEQLRSIHKMEAIGQLAGGIAHDFNNILGAISGYADIILNRYNNDEKLTKYSSMIISAATRAAELTSKLLTFSRKSKLQMIAFDIHDILSDVKDLLDHTIGKNVIITSDLSAKESIIIGDSSQFQSSIMNLVLNARDAMPAGGTLLIKTGNITIDNNFSKSRAYSVAPGFYVFTEVSDTGTGIDKQTMSHLFEPFFTTKDIGKGTGLGLASVYGTVNSHRGYIDVASEQGKGTTFTLYFPVSQMTPDSDSDTANIQKGKGHILVVDDDRFVLDAIEEMLSWLGYNVSVVQSGEEAIGVAMDQKIDVMIIDMMMPGMNGIECYKKIKAQRPSIKAILATGYQMNEEENAILNEGFKCIIKKPFVSAQLAQVIYDTLNS